MMAAATPGADLPALYASLHHWGVALRQLGPLKLNVDEHPADRRTDPRTLWIECRDQSKSPFSAHCMEGIALLTLLARVHATAWRIALKYVWASDSKTRAWIDNELKALTTGCDAENFAMGVTIFVTDRGQPSLTTSQSIHISIDTFSEEMKTALKAMKISISSEAGGVRIPVDFFLNFSDGNDGLNLALEAIHNIKAEQFDNKTAVVQLDIVSINEFDTSLDVTALETMLKIRALGVWIESLSPLSATCAAFEDASRVTAALRALLLESPKEALAVRSSGVESVTVSDRMPVALVEAVLSAVECSRIVRSVHVQVDGEQDGRNHQDAVDRVAMWRIVARTLFSRRARHHVKRLLLGVLEFPSTLLEAVHHELLEDSRSSSTNSIKQSESRITASRFHMRPTTAGDDPKDIVYESSEPLEVLLSRPRFTDASRQWWTVLLPGHGEAWVEDVDVLNTVDYELQPSAVSPLTFDSITISYISDSSMENVGALLQLIGHGTRKLDISDHWGVEYMDEWVDLALGACPNVEDVELGYVRLESLDPFVQRALSDGARLRRLSIPHRGYNSLQLESFLEALTDPNHPLTIHLQDLTLQLQVGSWHLSEFHDEDDVAMRNHELERDLAPVLQMLEKNLVLRKVVFIVPLRGLDDQALKEVIEELFECTEHSPWIPTGPLDMASKVALLSVFHGDQAVRTDRVDSNIMAIIFEFAAPFVRRDFQLAISVHDD